MSGAASKTVAAPAVRTWAVVCRSTTGAAPVVLAYLVDVPASVHKPEVEDRISLWRLWPAWVARLGAGGGLYVRLHRGELVDGPMVLGWDVLAPESRKAQVELPGDLYARARRAARIAGEPLTVLMARAIAAEVERLEACLLPVDGAQ